jgi:hypothetical protein
MLKTLKIVVISLVAFMSLSAHAKIESFQDSFAGYLNKDIQMDFFWFAGQNTFMNGSVILSTQHEIINLEQDFYLVTGSYTRVVDNITVSSGTFDFNVIYPDPNIPQDPMQILMPIEGTIQFDNSVYSPETGDRLVANLGFGWIKGFIDKQDYVSFTIDWQTDTPALTSAVPEPSSIWLMSYGFLLIAVCLFYRRHRAQSRLLVAVHNHAYG